MYSWHYEIYKKSLDNMIKAVGYHGEACLGWLGWLEMAYPEHYKKYNQALDKTEKLWDSMDPKDMEEFKAAVKIETDATIWVIDKFIKYKKTRETQEVLL